VNVLGSHRLKTADEILDKMTRFGLRVRSEDCSASTQSQSGPITIEERIVIVDDGNEVRSITATPKR
jgi:hypothetical protein